MTFAAAVRAGSERSSAADIKNGTVAPADLSNTAQPVTGCGWTATLNDNDASSVSTGQIAVERNSAGDPNTLRVRTYTSLGANEDTPAGDGFTVVVHC